MRAMKDSGVDWIGEIPVDWTVTRIKSLFRETNDRCKHGSDFTLLSVSEYYGVAPRKEKIDTNDMLTHAESLDGYKICHKNNLVMNIMLAWKRALGISEYEGIVSPAYCVYQAKQNICGKYFHYLFRTDIYANLFKQFSTGIIDSRLRLYPDKFLSLKCQYPPFVEQQRIADYLDRQCTAIDASIEKEKESISRLEEYRQSVITEAVTRGLDPAAPMKDSGTEGIGSIPLSWLMIKIKFLFYIKKEIAGQDGYAVLSITQKGVIPKDISKNEGQMAANYSHYQVVNPGDFAMNHMDLLTGWIDISNYIGVTSPDYRVFSMSHPENHCPRYFLYFFQMCYINRIFYGLGQGVSGMGRWRLPADQFLNFKIPVPSHQEQQQIATYLDEQCGAIDRLISRKQSVIDKLTEYKKSLIYETVTGKREV